ncbi:MAG: FliM/FliN family flagellar motor switch protein [Deltaproteobacteria bacterium]|nr:FliM/FliN family flagellar motor switch protein [Deltaproteobacteria bacterium]
MKDKKGDPADDPYLNELESSLEEMEKEEIVTDDPTQVDLQKEPVPVPAKAGSPKVKKVPEGLLLTQDVPVSLVAVLGRKTVNLKELLGFKMGQVVELDKGPGDAVDVVVNGKVVAKGELVDVEGKIGIRILRMI